MTKAQKRKLAHKRLDQIERKGTSARKLVDLTAEEKQAINEHIKFIVSNIERYNVRYNIVKCMAMGEK